MPEGEDEVAPFTFPEANRPFPLEADPNGRAQESDETCRQESEPSLAGSRCRLVRRRFSHRYSRNCSW